ncbi:MAG: acetylesterase, partial [Solobacterium sp.]|nr:acetylesterase [Solobacterium sp.]
MALIQVNYLSKALFRTVPVQVILPVDRISFETMDYEPVQRKFKTLYLLHGLLGNYTDWVSGTRIQRWAEEKNLAVVMPSGDNSF